MPVSGTRAGLGAHGDAVALEIRVALGSLKGLGAKLPSAGKERVDVLRTRWI